jgi:DnaJ-class molecular chaperone
MRKRERIGITHEGVRVLPHVGFDSQFAPQRAICPMCKGKGKWNWFVKCSYCNGKGVITV